MGGYIALALLALLALALFAPVKAEFIWRREVLSLRLRLLWLFPLSILPAKPGREEGKPKRPKRPRKERAKKAPKKQDPAERALEFIQTVNDLLPHLASFAGYILRRLTLSRCRIALVIAGEEAEAAFQGQGYGVFKPAVGDAVVELFRPIREEAQRLMADKAYLEGIYREGAERAARIAGRTLTKVYKKVGFLPR